jgi:bZIP transcription factor
MLVNSSSSQYHPLQHQGIIMNTGDNTADAAAGVFKRRAEETQSIDEPEAKKFAAVPTSPDAALLASPPEMTAAPENSKKGREIRLEQNRKAAKESRRRKKVMVEELQRSVIFFSRANSTLKQQNNELTRLLIEAQMQVKKAESPNEAEAPTTMETPQSPPPAATTVAVAPAPMTASVAQTAANDQASQQLSAQLVATQALYESQGFPAAAARAAAQAMNSSAGAPLPFAAATGMMPPPPMQTGATMQAMANFQQAAAAAMQAAIQGMHGLGGMSALALPGVNAAQSFTDTMTALAMQQAAAQHMGQHMLQLSSYTGTPAAAESPAPIKEEPPAE